MVNIKKLTKENISEYVDIVADAFPRFKLLTLEDKIKTQKRLYNMMENGFCAGVYGCFENDCMVGGMRFYNFNMNVFGKKIVFGGLGTIAVNLTRRKEKIAAKMVSHFLSHYRKNGVFLVGLFPFRPDFYRKMGFGFGCKTKRYCVTSAQLPLLPKDMPLRLLTIAEKDQIVACYNRYAERHHGCIELSQYDVEYAFKENWKIAGFPSTGPLEGYVKFRIEHDANGDDHMHITEIIYDNRVLFTQLFSFVGSLTDQVTKIIIETNDDYFHVLFDNPSNGLKTIFLHHQSNVEEIGIMYRIIDIGGYFKAMREHNFNGVSAIIKFTIHDSFFQDNDGSWTIRFSKGIAEPCVDSNHEVEVEMDISDFSSMVMGAAPFSAFYTCARAEITNPDRISQIDRLFLPPEKPFCHTRF